MTSSFSTFFSSALMRISINCNRLAIFLIRFFSSLLSSSFTSYFSCPSVVVSSSSSEFCGCSFFNHLTRLRYVFDSFENKLDICFHDLASVFSFVTFGSCMLNCTITSSNASTDDAVSGNDINPSLLVVVICLVSFVYIFHFLWLVVRAPFMRVVQDPVVCAAMNIMMSLTFDLKVGAFMLRELV
jgi:hypothetical protein